MKTKQTYDLGGVKMNYPELYQFEQATYNDYTFNVYRIYSENPGGDGFLTVANAPEDIKYLNGSLFLDKEEIYEMIDTY